MGVHYIPIPPISREETEALLLQELRPLGVMAIGRPILSLVYKQSKGIPPKSPDEGRLEGLYPRGALAGGGGGMFVGQL